MLLISPTRAANAIGSKCSVPDGTGDEQLLEMLRLITSHAENALGVRSLTRGSFTDTFDMPRTEDGLRRQFRLTNGFIVPGSVVVSGAYKDDATPITAPEFVDEEHGIVKVAPYYYGDDTERLTITYQSGFAVPADTGPGDDVNADVNYRVLTGIPDNIAGAVVDMLINWRRNNLATPSAPKEYGFLPNINLAVIRDLKGYLYGRYLRPRDYLHFPIRYTSNG